MDDNKIQDLLLKLVEDIAVVRAKVESLDEIKSDQKVLNSRIDKLDMISERQEKSIKSLENRANTMEKFTRDNLMDTKKQQTSVFISLGMAIFSAILSVIMNFFK